MGYSFVDVHTLEGEGPGGAVRKLRAALGARDAGARRRGDGLEFVTFGAPLDSKYEPPSWG